MSTMGRPVSIIYALATAEELTVELGRLIMLTRTVRGFTTDALAKASQSSVEEIERVESGQGGDLLTLLRIAQTLQVSEALMKAFDPPLASLDEVERREQLIQAEREPKAHSPGDPPA